MISTDSSRLERVVVQKANAAISPAAGNVTSQATEILPKIRQLTEAPELAVPVPVIAPATVCVVDTGAPIAVEPNNATAAAVSAVNPLTGRSGVMRWPIVRTIRQPPDEVPSAMAVAAASATHSGTVRFPPPF